MLKNENCTIGTWKQGWLRGSRVAVAVAISIAVAVTFTVTVTVTVADQTAAQVISFYVLAAAAVTFASAQPSPVAGLGTCINILSN